MTKRYKRLYIIFTILSVMCFVVPAAYFILEGFILGTGIATKVALSSTIVIALILSAVGYAKKKASRSSLWVLVLGLYICLQEIMPILIIVGSAQILDELVFTPLAAYYKSLYIPNKVYDKRMGIK